MPVRGRLTGILNSIVEEPTGLLDLPLSIACRLFIKGRQPMDTTFITNSGFTIRLKAVSPMLIQKVGAILHDPTPPVYKIKSLTGEEIKFEHDESTIADPSTSEVERLQWKEYQKKLREMDAQRRLKLMDVMFARGIVFDVPDDGWEEEHVFLGLTVPTNPIEKKVHYLQTEVLTSAADIQEVVSRLMQMTRGLSDQEVEEVRATFQRSLQGATLEGMAPEVGDSNGFRQPAADAEGMDVFDPLS